MITQGISLFLLSGLFVSSAFALPVNPTVSLESFRRLPAVRPVFKMPNGNLRAINFEGIVALSNCSGAIVRYESSRDDDQAMVLTNGHCIESGFIEPGAFVLNELSSRSFAVLEPSSGRSLGNVQAEKIIYATMTKTDATLYRLKQTYREISEKFRVRALTLASRPTTPGQKIEIVSGYWRRGYSCAVEYFVNTIREDKWTWRNSIRYTRPGCETIGGTSGSPIVAAGTDQVVGVNNTANESGAKCTMNNPCEMDSSGKVVVEKGVSYGQQTALIYSCLDNELRFDLKAPTCRLPGGAQSGSPSVRVATKRSRPARH